MSFNWSIMREEYFNNIQYYIEKIVFLTWNIMTEAKMVKNFLVVVMIEHVRGPKAVTVINMKFWKMNAYNFIRKRLNFVGIL